MIVLLSSRYLASRLLCTERRERIKGRKSLKPFPSEAIDWGSAWTPRYRWQIATRPETLITHTRGGRQSLAHFDTIGKQQLLKAKGNINLISSGETCQQVEIVIDSSPFLVYSQGRNMVYGLRAQSPKYDWDQGSQQRAQGSEEWDQGSQGFWARIRDQIYYAV